VKEFKSIQANDTVEITSTPVSGETRLCGVEIVLEEGEPDKASKSLASVQ
jgi:hypothetical protein